MSDDKGNQSNTKQKIIVGILTAPDQPEEIIGKIKNTLPELLNQYVDDEIEWEIHSNTDPLTGTEGFSQAIINELSKIKEHENWDMAISITDLPIFVKRRLIVADADVKKNLAYISLPALGATPLKKRVREAIIQLKDEIHHGAESEDREEREGEHSSGKADLFEKNGQ